MAFKEQVNNYINHLPLSLAKATRAKYKRDLLAMLAYVDKGTTAELLAYKDHLQATYKISTVNSKITSINGFLKSIERETLPYCKTQQKMTTEGLTDSEFARLLKYARLKGTKRDLIMLQSLYYTGLRVSELQYLTIQALQAKQIQVYNKGKHRIVPLCKDLVQLLKAYVKANPQIVGPIICTSKGTALDRTTVHKRIKYLAGQARIKLSKAHAHNIRHLFAKKWLSCNKHNVLQLADLMGHSNLETTRIYTRLSPAELAQTIRF